MEGAMAFAEALSVNKTLKRIELSSLRYKTVDGTNANGKILECLMEGVAKNQGLVQMDLCKVKE